MTDILLKRLLNLIPISVLVYTLHLAFASLGLGIAIMAILGSGLEKVILCLGVVMTPRFARIAYGATMAIRPKEFIEAANVTSAPFPQILWFHILPNIVTEIVVVAILWIGTAMQIEASLSFIGIGVPPPNPTWGNMIKAALDTHAVEPRPPGDPLAAERDIILTPHIAGGSRHEMLAEIRMFLRGLG